MNPPVKRISIILPSFNDARIGEAIKSIRRFDDLNTVRIVVIDGGSKADVRDIISAALTPEDIFICEPDRGIFDGLNKGLDNSNTEFVGWIGSDDLFTGRILASDVIRALKSADLFAADIAYFRDERVTRITHALPSRLGLVKFGLHNPHYATFGRAAILKSERFRLDIPYGSDIEYFIRIFEKHPTVVTENVICTLQSEGGFSTQSYFKMLKGNLPLAKIYGQHTHSLFGPFALMIKFGYKAFMVLFYKLFPLTRRSFEVPRSTDN